MNTTVKIILASLFALSAQYISDILSLMASALLPHNCNDFLQSTMIGITNIIVTVLIFKYIALRWFHIDSSFLFLYAKLKDIIIASLICITIFGTLALFTLPMTTEFIILPKERVPIILYNSLLNRGISTAIGEELIFRGFLFSYILSLTNPIKAFVISIFVFTMPHVLIFQPNWHTLLILFNYLSISLLLTTLYFKTKNISTAISFHAMYNFILYGIWNVANTGEPSSAIVTSLMSNHQTNIYIVLLTVFQIAVTYFVLIRKNPSYVHDIHRL